MLKKFAFKKNGFSLLGLMLAIAISTVVIIGSLLTFINCAFLNETNNNLIIAANDAQSILEEVKTLAYTGIDTYTPTQLNNLDNEIITFQINNIDAGIKEVTVIVAWTEKGRNKNFLLSTRVAR
jgi:type II secretory pathway pseudopilin PulG